MVGALHVTSRNGVMPFKGKDVGPDSVAKALSVGTIVSGTVQRAATRSASPWTCSTRATGNSIGEHEDREDQGGRLRAAGHARDGGVGGAAQADRPAGAGAHEQGGDEQRRGVGGVPAGEADGRQADSLLAAGDVAAATTRCSARADTALGAVAKQDGKWAAPSRSRQSSRTAWRGSRSARRRHGRRPRADRRRARARRARARHRPNDADALEARGSLRYLQWLLNLAPTRRRQGDCSRRRRISRRRSRRTPRRRRR